MRRTNETLICEPAPSGAGRQGISSAAVIVQALIARGILPGADEPG